MACVRSARTVPCPYHAIGRTETADGLAEWLFVDGLLPRAGTHGEEGRQRALVPHGERFFTLPPFGRVVPSARNNDRWRERSEGMDRRPVRRARCRNGGHVMDAIQQLRAMLAELGGQLADLNEQAARLNQRLDQLDEKAPHSQVLRDE